MRPDDRTLVVVQLEWNSWQTATVRLADLEDIHWRQPTGAPRPLIHARVPCAAFGSGRLAHEGSPRSTTHRVLEQMLVCVLKHHNAPQVYAELTHRAGEPVSMQGPRVRGAAAAIGKPTRGLRGLVAGVSVSAVIIAAAIAGLRWWRGTMAGNRELLETR